MTRITLETLDVQNILLHDEPILDRDFLFAVETESRRPFWLQSKQRLTLEETIDQNVILPSLLHIASGSLGQLDQISVAANH